MQQDKFNKVLYVEFGKRLKTWRHFCGYNQEEFASKIEGIGRTSISNIESGNQQPPLHIVYQICKALGIEVYELLPSIFQIEDETGGSEIKGLKESLKEEKKTQQVITDVITELNLEDE